ncbi:hypothetical protein O3M35_006705 [Rhynocoris fuscipes]|uniref:N-acetylneuraminate-9-phosphate synthase n=1 Tax=Rhynocoris fuscipes TaxID=488301 RepID=A0AAW1DEF8_9HEMI
MRTLHLPTGKVIGENEPCFIIAEIGQNHQGDIDIAKKLIASAKECGADCVKFQKSCLKEKFTKQTLNTPYISEHSWGRTYGEHKKYLEFSESQYIELMQYAEDIGILFTASAMDSVSLEFLASRDVPFIKIGSGDGDNLMLIENAASTKIPLVISTGMQAMINVKKVYKTVKKYHSEFALLHCVSSYPTPPEDANLKVITKYKEEFPDIVIGYSGHELNYNLTIAAVVLGAKIVERHFTLDNNWKGNDHKCSLTPNNFKKMVDSIREIEIAMGNGIKEIQPSELECYNKLGKTLVTAKCLQSGCKLDITDIKVKVSSIKGISPIEIYNIIGRKLKNDLEEDQIIKENDLESE